MYSINHSPAYFDALGTGVFALECRTANHLSVMAQLMPEIRKACDHDL